MSTRVSVITGVGIALGAVALIGGQAHAQNMGLPSGPPTFYVGGEGGWTDLEDHSDRLTSGGSARARFDSGYNVGARAGAQWGPWRLEEEYSYHNNGLDRFTVGPFNIPGASGQREAHAIMTNILYDFNGLNWPVTPHVGVGVGAVDIVDGVKLPGVGQVFNNDDWEFGYQGIAGVEYNISPALAVDLDYRYLATTDATFTVPSIPSVKYHSGYSTHNIVASLIYRFGPPPLPIAAPPIVEAPPPPPSRRVFLVFFDWDRSTITPEGMRIIAQAADAFRSGAPVQLQVTGYTDRSGSPGYNQRLSERRANNVANTLVRDGVPRDQMAVSGRGENDNRVPTANGVREPQNRRVEIVFP